jgi:hypothetical protein
VNEQLRGVAGRRLFADRDRTIQKHRRPGILKDKTVVSDNTLEGAKEFDLRKSCFPRVFILVLPLTGGRDALICF